MDECRGADRSHRGDAADGGFHWLGIARAGADGADAAVQAAGVFRQHDRELCVLCGDVWRVVSLAAIPANRTRLWTVWRRPAALALDRDAVRDRAGRGWRRQQSRRTPAGRDGIIDAGHRPRLDRDNSFAWYRLFEPGRAAGLGGRRGLDGVAGSTKWDFEFGCGGRDGQSVRPLLHGPPALRRVW